MNILAFDTSTDACSVALHHADQLLEDHQLKPQQQAALLLPTIDRLMGEAGLTANQLDGVVFGRGPGSFTGLRIAASTAQGIAMGADIGVWGISTLAAVAQGCARETDAQRILVLMDARLNEVYGSYYQLQQSGVVANKTKEQLLAPADVQTLMPSAEAFTVTGSGMAEYANTLQPLMPESATLDAARLPRAADLITLAIDEVGSGSWQSADAALPVYLRDKVALTEAERQAT
jgi:tRNA threonylcarbamoyladenosine biosynthesis protein TsaB